MENKFYVCIDLKSFYASIECMDRKLDPLKTNLVVADPERTEKTICLAVSPSLKAYGISGRARLFEVLQKVREVNKARKRQNGNREFMGETSDDEFLKAHPEYALGFIIAPPQMARYIEISTKIYDVYLKYVSAEDMHVYSIDEVFLDVTDYLKAYKTTAKELASTMIREVLKETGITATAGVGTNLYLAKIAMDIVAKHIPPDENGVRIAELDETSYRKELWTHRPLTDFWRVGRGYAKRLEELGLFTMGDIAKCSTGTTYDFYNEDLLYKEFGVNAELLIDHAWGYEPTPISAIKAYRPRTNSLSSGQVLQEPYPWEKARLVVREMAGALSLDLVEKKLATNQLVMNVGYDVINLKGKYEGEIVFDRYGRKTPKEGHGSFNLPEYTSSTRVIENSAVSLFDRITDKKLFIRRINISVNALVGEEEANKNRPPEQLDLFGYDESVKREERKKLEHEREKKMQKAVIGIKKKFGKNAILTGVSYEDGATGKQRNGQIGGHKA